MSNSTLSTGTMAVRNRIAARQGSLSTQLPVVARQLPRPVSSAASQDLDVRSNLTQEIAKRIIDSIPAATATQQQVPSMETPSVVDDVVGVR
jgi:hypothetical protein